MRIAGLVVLAWGSVAPAVAVAGQPPARQSTPATRPAVVAPHALAPDDPLMKDPVLAKAMAATPITLKLDNAPALNALAELAKQTGYEVGPYDGRNARYGNVTINATGVPFWAAFRDVCTRANINLYDGGGESQAISVLPSNYGGAGAMRGPASIKGPFLVLAQSLSRINSVHMNEPGKVNRNIQIQIQTYIEPKIRPLEVSYQPIVTEAVDENGNSMKPTEPPQGRQNMQHARNVGAWGNISLPYPTTNPGKRIVRVKGYIDADVQMSGEMVEIADPLKAKETPKTLTTGQRITFNSLKKQNDSGLAYQAEIVFHRGDIDPNQFNSAINDNVLLHLTDAKGQRYSFHNNGGSGDGEKQTQLFLFPTRSRNGTTLGEPVKLVIEVPTAKKEIAIPFELVDLAMP